MMCPQAHQASRFSTRYKVATGSNAPRTLPKRGFDPLRFHQENQTLNLLFCSFCQISIAYVQADADGCLAKLPVIKAAAYELPMRLPPKTVPR